MLGCLFFYGLLVKLDGMQVIRALQRQHRTDTQWRNLVESLVDLEDVNRNLVSHERSFKSSFEPAKPSLVHWIYGPKLSRCRFFFTLSKSKSNRRL